VIGPLKLTWTRTVIGGQTKPYDFATKLDGVAVGRIYKTEGTSHSGPFSLLIGAQAQ
jgi:hypothetical protein